MKIYLATDHAGFNLKEKVKEYLSQKGLEIEDCGAYSLNKDDDYPDFVKKAAISVSKDPENSKGIIFGKSGAGEAIVANKFKGIRAVIGFNAENVKLSREHNNANVLSIGSAFVAEKEIEKLVLIFINTTFSNEKRHVRRIEKIKEIEENS